MKYIKFVKSVGSLAQTDTCMDPNQYRTEKRKTGQNVMNKTCFVSLSRNQMADILLSSFLVILTDLKVGVGGPDLCYCAFSKTFNVALC